MNTWSELAASEMLTSWKRRLLSWPASARSTVLAVNTAYGLTSGHSVIKHPHCRVMCCVKGVSLQMSLPARACCGARNLGLWWDKRQDWWPTIITSNPTHLHYFPSLLWNSGHIAPQAYNLKSTEFRDLLPGIRGKGRAEGLPNFRDRDNACGSGSLWLPLNISPGPGVILEARRRGLVKCCSKPRCD